MPKRKKGQPKQRKKKGSRRSRKRKKGVKAERKRGLKQRIFQHLFSFQSSQKKL